MFGHRYFSAHYFGPHYFGPSQHTVTDTDLLQKPVNCILAGQQDYKFSEREWDVRLPNVKTKATLEGGIARRLSKSPPEFTTTTNNKGYD